MRGAGEGDLDCAFRRHHPMRRTVGISPGEGLGEGTPSPAKRAILAPPLGSRAGAGVLAERAREGRKPGKALYTPLSSHPHPPPASGAPPPPRGGGSSRDISGMAGPGRRPRVCSFAGIIPCTGPWWQSPGGGGRGGNSLPGKENHTGPPLGSRAGAGVLVARAREGRKPGLPALILSLPGISSCTILLSPPPRPRLRRSSPAPKERGSSRDISGKAGPGCRPRVCSFAGIIPYTGPWGYHRGRGRGGCGRGADPECAFRRHHPIHPPPPPQPWRTLPTQKEQPVKKISEGLPPGPLTGSVLIPPALLVVHALRYARAARSRVVLEETHLIGVHER